MSKSDLDLLYETLTMAHDAIPPERTALRWKILAARSLIFEEMKNEQ